jgi:hypothetical protein
MIRLAAFGTAERDAIEQQLRRPFSIRTKGCSAESWYSPNVPI